MKKLLSFTLCAILLMSACIPAYAMDSAPTSQLLFKTEGQYGTVFYVNGSTYNSNGYTGKGTVDAQCWDVIDVIMAGMSWADLLKQPSWGNFAWAVLDTAAIVPLVPSSGWIRRGNKVVGVTDDALKKLAKDKAGAKAIKNALKGYKYSDAIGSKALKEVKKKWGDKGVQAFKDAADRGHVASKGETGITKLKATDSSLGKKYTHEIKNLKDPYGDYRIFGYKNSDGSWIFDKFGRGLNHK